MKLTYDVILENDIDINASDGLIIVDMQNDFIPGGALPVEEGDQIIDDINNVAEVFKSKGGKVILTQDWHPSNHKSFASQHEGKNPGDEFQTDGIGPILWPDHCVQGTDGAKFHKDLKNELANATIKKGMTPDVDSYSGFLENDKKSKTNLNVYLKALGVKRIFVCGLALDYCVGFTALDGVDLGYKVYFLIDLTKGIDLPPGNISNILETMTSKGVKFVNSNKLVS
jgi:nicotinamidase/pyrazinamidase